MFQRSYHLHFDGSPRRVSCIKENKYYTGRTGKAIRTVGAWEYEQWVHGNANSGCMGILTVGAWEY
jgi:hypothetical protein